MILLVLIFLDYFVAAAVFLYLFLIKLYREMETFGQWVELERKN